MRAPLFSSLLLSVSQEPALPLPTQKLFLDARPLAFSKDPPGEVRLFAMGPNHTLTHGVLWLDEQSIKDCLTVEAGLGRDLYWDWNHYSEPNGPTPPPGTDPNRLKVAAGYFSLQGRPDGLWAVMPRQRGPRMGLSGILWTPQGDADIRSLSYGNYSPAVLTVERGGRKYIAGVTSCALTNFPQTLGQPPLLCAAQGTPMSWEQLLAGMMARGASQAEIDEAKRAYDIEHAGEQPAAQPQSTQARQAAALVPAQATQSVQLAGAAAPTTPAQSSERERELQAQLAASQAQLDAERRTNILLANARRFTPAERPTLEQMPPALLEQLLLARSDIPLMGQPLRIQAPASSGPRVSGGNNLLTTYINGESRPWHHLNYRERALLSMSNSDVYRAMRRQAAEQGIPLFMVEKEHLGRPVTNVKQLLLATGVTVPDDVIEINPQVLEDAIQAGFAGLRVLAGSPAVMTKSDLPMWNLGAGRQVKGGDTITIPLWSALGASEEVTDEASVPSTVQKLETTKEDASVRHFRIAAQLAYLTSAFAAQGSDPIAEAARQMGEIARNDWEDILIEEARSTSLGIDISAIGSGYLTYDCFPQALAEWGDEEFDGSGQSGAIMFMHSNSLRQIRTIKDGMGMPIFQEPRDGMPPRVLGIPVRISDRFVTDSGNHVLTIVKPGALALWYNAEKLKVQNFHDVSTDQDLNVIHNYFAAHLYTRPARRTKTGAVNITHKPLA